MPAFIHGFIHVRANQISSRGSYEAFFTSGKMFLEHDPGNNAILTMSLSPVSLGMLLLLAGLICFLLVWGLPRLFPRLHNHSLPVILPQKMTDSSQQHHAVMVIQSGGRVNYVNAIARQWFEIHEGEQLNLEVLAKRIRPTDDFLKLCTGEGQMRFTVRGRPVEAASYQIPGPIPSLLVSFRMPDRISTRPGVSTEAPELALKILTNLSQSLATSPGVAATIQTLLENTERLVPVDFLELKLWNADERTLVPYRLEPRTGSEKRLEKGFPQSPVGYSALLVESHQTLFIPDTKTNTKVAPENDEQALLFSYIGLPLLAGNDLVGTLEVGLTKDEVFDQDILDILQLVGGQAATAIHNASLLEAERQRSAELSGLVNLTKALGSIHEARDLFTHLVESIAPLFNVDVLGFLIYDENRRTLEAQMPFAGLPAQAVEIYHVPLLSGGPAEECFMKQEILTTQNAMEDKLWLEMGIQDYARAASWHDTALIPLTSSGHLLGYLQISNHHNPETAFSHDEMRIMNIVANQAAVAIQNGRLFSETRRLTDELELRVIERTSELAREKRNTETLLHILTEISSTLDLDRTLNRTLALLNDATGAEQGSILMITPEDNAIQYRAGYGYLTPTMTGGARPTALKTGEGLAGWVIEHREPVCIDDISKDDRWIKIPPYSSSHRSAIAAPLLVGEEVIGAILMFHRKVGFFSTEAMNLVQAIGNQVAVAINNAQLYLLIRDQAERLGTMLRNQQVEASRQHAILEAVADGVLVTDSNNEITFLNSSAERIMDLKEGHIKGQSLDNFVGVFGKAAQTWMQTIHSWSEDPSSHQPGDTYAEQLTLETGQVVLVHLAPVIWRDEFLGTVSIFRDITQEVEVDRLKSEFVATVSHELRTPLTSIKGYVDILLMGAAGALNDNQLHFLDVVRTNTERLSVLVNDLLDISRIEAGRISLSFQSIDLCKVAEDVITDISRRSQDEKKPMGVTLDAPVELPSVRGDEKRVHQILTNLVNNAYHYTPEKGHIIIHLRPVEGAVQVDVEDNGIGIDPVDADRIFERFFRGEDPLVLATPGTGLGLAIVKQLVTLHKGRIWMTSKGIPGEGSTFSFTLPIYPNRGETRMTKILIAEDERDIRDLITFTLGFAGFEVVATSNGEEALNLARQELPDLILMDVRMPRMTGYEACAAVKADPKLKNIPVVFLSAKGQDSEIQAGLKAGAVDYILKPFAPDQLTERIKAVLAQFGK